ncbi:hypothetical protein ACIBTV_30915, partial [Micromonospora sp. NPDC049366]|uniref:hypothetical protein n=1 Tax=Micromonospora sp. NPDC049366 TaxID=3364271 RepID=UPI003790E856
SKPPDINNHQPGSATLRRVLPPAHSLIDFRVSPAGHSTGGTDRASLLGGEMPLAAGRHAEPVAG